jgi:hypothetical protein
MLGKQSIVARIAQRNGDEKLRFVASCTGFIHNSARQKDRDEVGDRRTIYETRESITSVIIQYRGRAMGIGSFGRVRRGSARETCL